MVHPNVLVKEIAAEEKPKSERGWAEAIVKESRTWLITQHIFSNTIFRRRAKASWNMGEANRRKVSNLGVQDDFEFFHTNFIFQIRPPYLTDKSGKLYRIEISQNQ